MNGEWGTKADTPEVFAGDRERKRQASFCRLRQTSCNGTILFVNLDRRVVTSNYSTHSVSIVDQSDRRGGLQRYHSESSRWRAQASGASFLCDHSSVGGKDCRPVFEVRFESSSRLLQLAFCVLWELFEPLYGSPSYTTTHSIHACANCKRKTGASFLCGHSSVGGEDCRPVFEVCFVHCGNLSPRVHAQYSYTCSKQRAPLFLCDNSSVDIAKIADQYLNWGVLVHCEISSTLHH